MIVRRLNRRTFVRFCLNNLDLKETAQRCRDVEVTNVTQQGCAYNYARSDAVAFYCIENGAKMICRIILLISVNASQVQDSTINEMSIFHVLIAMLFRIYERLRSNRIPTTFISHFFESYSIGANSQVIKCNSLKKTFNNSPLVNHKRKQKMMRYLAFESGNLFSGEIFSEIAKSGGRFVAGAGRLTFQQTFNTLLLLFMAERRSRRVVIARFLRFWAVERVCQFGYLHRHRNRSRHIHFFKVVSFAF